MPTAPPSSPAPPMCEDPWRVDAYDYALPPDLIAQHPAAQRDASRLMRVDRQAQTVSHGRFSELPDLLNPGDLLVLNDTRVIPARLLGRKKSGGEVEVFLSHPLSDGGWEALVRLSSGRARAGLDVSLPGGRVRLINPLEDGLWRVELDAEGPVMEWLERVGAVPLPPYIGREDPHANRAIDRERYQTVYAREPGAVAAPTAGLHFTPEIFERLARRGVGLARVTLHVGLGTFRPVKVERLDQVQLHAEWYRLPAETIEAIEAARRAGKRVVAVGTTTVRVLESAVKSGRWEPHEGETRLFLHPGCVFDVVDGLVTNFHLPRSSLLMLVAAFAGKSLVDRAYREAVANRYRFYSYGDAMVIL